MLGHFLKCLGRATNKMDIPNTLEKRNYTASYTCTVYKVFKILCPEDNTWKDRSQPQKQGKD
jgi:hypothetical protein